MGVHEFIPSEPVPEQSLVTVEFLYRSGEHEQYPRKELPWQGITKKVRFSDPFSGITFELVKMAPGITFPEHYLTTTQVTYLLEGHQRREDGSIVQTGSFRSCRGNSASH